MLLAYYLLYLWC